MSLISGICAKRPTAPARMDRIPRLAGNTRSLEHVWSDDRLYLQKFDIGAFAPGWSHTDRSVTALAGDAILTSGLRDRSHDTAALDAEALEPVLKRSRGYFNLASHDKLSRVLTLQTIASACVRCTCMTTASSSCSQGP